MRDTGRCDNSHAPWFALNRECAINCLAVYKGCAIAFLAVFAHANRAVADFVRSRMRRV